MNDDKFNGSTAQIVQKILLGVFMAVSIWLGNSELQSRQDVVSINRDLTHLKETLEDRIRERDLTIAGMRTQIDRLTERQEQVLRDQVHQDDRIQSLEMKKP